MAHLHRCNVTEHPNAADALQSWPAYKSFMPFRLYFEESYPKARIQANRDLLASVIDEEDVQRFATVAESVVRREFGQRKWAFKAGDLLNPEKPDQLLVVAIVVADRRHLDAE